MVYPVKRDKYKLKIGIGLSVSLINSSTTESVFLSMKNSLMNVETKYLEWEPS